MLSGNFNFQSGIWAHPAAPNLRFDAAGPGYPLQQKTRFPGAEFARSANSENKKPPGFLFRFYPLRVRAFHAPPFGTRPVWN
jgi:hypothetical protein